MLGQFRRKIGTNQLSCDVALNKCLFLSTIKLCLTNHGWMHYYEYLSLNNSINVLLSALFNACAVIPQLKNIFSFPSKNVVNSSSCETQLNWNQQAHSNLITTLDVLIRRALKLSSDLIEIKHSRHEREHTFLRAATIC